MKLTGCPPSRDPWRPGYPRKWRQSACQLRFGFVERIAYLDQDSLLVDTELLVEVDELVGLGNGTG